MINNKPKDIDEYISGFPKATQDVLKQVRETIKLAAPEAEEKISYAMPTFTLHKVYLVYFAAYEKHIGFYPTPVGIEAFKEDFFSYKTGKGSVQFPLDKPMPLDLITKIVKYRIKENLENAREKKKKKTTSSTSSGNNS